ncbi:MAG: hypothetical protein PHH58_00410 [Rhodoferax sp.]|nr:hypothetical protein [Rhodoferax sp.]
MASKDHTPGFFSRVANFVRSPVAPTADLDQVEVAQPGENSAQAINRVLQRKAHNDSVRKREFAQLRRMRQAMSGEAVDQMARDAFFLESSGFSVLEERASTLKKIDEIEAQMSRQWWKNRQQGLASESMRPMPAAATQPAQPSFDADIPTAFVATLPTDLALAASGVAVSEKPAASDASGASGCVKPPSQAPLQALPPVGNSVLCASKMISVEIGQTRSDPTLEAAALRFANGDDAGAETTLLEAIRATDGDRSCADTWAAALFDLYRSTAQAQRFDLFAQDYAQRFGRTAPGWVGPPRFDQTATVELAGELKGDLAALPSGLPMHGTPGSTLIVGCERLIRVDFAAAAAILNWVATRHELGQQIEFVQVPRLVAVFFSLIGINEHTRIRVFNQLGSEHVAARVV